MIEILSIVITSAWVKLDKGFSFRLFNRQFNIKYDPHSGMIRGVRWVVFLGIGIVLCGPVLNANSEFPHTKNVVDFVRYCLVRGALFNPL